LRVRVQEAARLPKAAPLPAEVRVAAGQGEAEVSWRLGARDGDKPAAAFTTYQQVRDAFADPHAVGAVVLVDPQADPKKPPLFLDALGLGGAVAKAAPVADSEKSLGPGLHEFRVELQGPPYDVRLTRRDDRWVLRSIHKADAAP
jgi:hypothetical protein